VLSPLVAELADGVHALVEARLPSNARVSVWAGEPGGPVWFEREPATRHYAASTMKLPLLVAAHRLAARGALDLDRGVPVHNEHRSAYDGSLFSLDQDDDQDDETWDRLGSEVALRTLAWHAVVKSGNLATDLLLEHVGTSEVAAVLRDAGCSPATVLPRGIADAAAREHGLDNLVTAPDLARVIGGVAARTLADPETCAAVEAVLAAQEHRDQVPAGLPEGVYVANKTGWVDGVAHDVALVRPDDGAPYVLVVCSTADADEQTLYALNAAVSRAVWAARPA
jgi:beta-lactamase class A